jgi:outer membrane receptor for ferrienterochelin and colicin
MRTLVIILIALIGFNLGAQNNRQGNKHRQHKIEQSQLSPEQQADLKSKKMALALDLNEAQKQKIYDLELTKARERKEFQAKRQAENQETMNGRYERQTARLDRQIAYKGSLKKILSKEQFEKWEKMNHKRRGNNKGNPGPGPNKGKW